MKKYIFSIVFVYLSSFSIFGQYKSDVLGNDFVSRTFLMNDDYEGKVISTLIKKIPSNIESKTALLYVHGYNDYFFQKQMAQKIDSAGYNFYAVDLRKFGRSLDTNLQYPFNVRSINEYFADIDSAINIIRNEGNEKIILMGHSTGGLITSLYVNANKNNLKIDALILNSPFLDMNLGWFKENILIPIVSFLGKWFPNIKIPQGSSSAYAESLLKEYNGEWNYNTDWKYIISPSVTAGWIRAIHLGQNLIQKGLDIPIPVLVMFSDKSVYGDKWNDDFNNGDSVLDVDDIEKYGKKLGKNVTEVVVPDGLHDLALSNFKARNLFYSTIFAFLDEYHLGR
ncbi:MAG: alpha/beta hydrolase [Bacteroidales bacterium]|nr:alpha/beta hydrolase [Bacteroidales bacterium]